MSLDSTTDQALSAAELSERVGGELIGLPDIVIRGVDALHSAEPEHVTFIMSSMYASEWVVSRAGVALVSRGIEVPGHDPSSRALIVVDDAELAMITALQHFAPESDPPACGVDTTAVVHETAQLGDRVRIGPNVNIASDVIVGNDVTISAGVCIGRGARIGDGSTIREHCVIGWGCVLGCRCQLQPLASVGADGFGFRPRSDGSGLERVPQIGIVELGDDVEVGANSCIDRAKFGATTIGEGSKLDNLVQVAHNVRIGRHCVLASQAGLAGSVWVGDWVQIGAQAGIADHIRIGDGARVGAKTGVMRDVEAGTSVLGVPADEARKFLRQLSSLRKLPEFMAIERSQSR